MTGCSCDLCTSSDPKDKRLRSSIMIREKGKTIVIDCSPDFRQQMLRENVKRVDAIIFTHSHKDHTGGLDDIRGYNYITKKPMPLYLNKETTRILKQQYDYIFDANDYPGIPKVKLFEIKNAPFLVDEIEIQPIEVMHYKMLVYAFRVNDFTYITDANYIAEEEKEKIKGSKIIIVNALRKEPHISHFSLSQAVDLVNEFQPEKAYFTHISHQLGYHAEVNKELPPHIELAYDGLSINC